MGEGDEVEDFARDEAIRKVNRSELSESLARHEHFEQKRK